MEYAPVDVGATQHWKDEPDDHHYPAAENYLNLLMSSQAAKLAVRRLRKAPLVHRKDKDLLRASRLPVLAPDNLHVARDLKKISSGQQLSPVLLLRGRLATDIPLTVADGYLRICASHHVDEDADIPCRIVDAARR